MLNAAAIVLATTLLASPTLAWGPVGHRAVGRIAERHMSPETAREVAALLAPERLAYVTIWADEIRSDPAWAKAETWHWVTVPTATTYADAKKNPTGDILEAIARFERVLADRSAPRTERQQAIKWLAHFVGDLHQPLHVGTRDDRGGNDTLVLWFGQPSNLHRVWDHDMIDHTELSFSELAEKVDVATPEQVRAWQASSPLEWADESRRMGERTYELGDRRLSWRYLFDHWPEVEQRVSQGGVRLAGLLTRALGAERDKAGSWLPLAVPQPVR